MMFRKKKSHKIEKVYSNFYKTMNINKLGWINCDAFYNQVTENFKIVYNSENDLTFTNPDITFKDINSVMNLNASKHSSLSNDTKLPLNQKVKIISFSCKDDKFYAATQEVTITKNGKLKMTLKEVSEKDIEKFFKI